MSTDAMGGETGLTGRFGEFLGRYHHEDIGWLAQHYPQEERSLEVSWQDLYRFDSDLAQDYLDAYGKVHGYLEDALQTYELPHDIDFSDAHVRVGDFPPSETRGVGQYSPSERHGDYFAIEGQVAKTTEVKPLPIEYAFECLRCGAVTRVPQNGPKKQAPHECKHCERQGPFRADMDKSETVDFQVVRIEQPPEEVQGGDSSNIDVRVRDDLTETVEPGDRASIAGVLRFDEGADESLPDPYLEGHAIDVRETDFEEVDIDSEDVTQIKAVAGGEHGDPLDVLADSISPKIRGHEDIKLAMVLQMFAGVRTTYPDGDTDRGNFHILLIGDPGTGKSRHLRAAENISPRGVYASGKGASAAGMTAAAVRDDFGDTQWSLEAGALVKAHKGVACVDEIDKVDPEAISSMHDVLSSGSVRVNKAGINTTLPAESALLAAGNPKYGRFDQYESLHEQLDIGPTLLSRFDLIFTLEDQPDESEDLKTAHHILDAKEAAKAVESGDATDDEAALVNPPIKRDLLRKYIAYARQDVSPRFASDEVKEELAQSFTSLRGANGYDEDDPVPVTWRKLDGLVRLAEAAAKVYLSETIEPEHVAIARQLVGTSLQQFGKDKDGNLDADTAESTATRTQQQLMRDVRELIEELQEEIEDGAVPEDSLLSEAEGVGMDPDRVEHAIEKMKQQREIYEPPSGGLRVV